MGKKNEDHNQRCCVCGEEAITTYNDEPSCGSTSCDLEIQSYYDYRSERDW